MSIPVHIGEQFRQMRDERGFTQEEARALVGCSLRTLGEFERTGGAPSVHERARRLMARWEAEIAKEQRATYRPHPSEVVHLSDLTDPLPVLIGGVQNVLALLRDDAVPVGRRLRHTRNQLRFLLENFLTDANLPAEPVDVV